jgi:hypothetical protein
MSTTQLYEKMTQLEAENEELVAELKEIDQLLRDVGFPYGLHSVKEIALELIEEKRDIEQIPDEDEKFT